LSIKIQNIVHHDEPVVVAGSSGHDLQHHCFYLAVFSRRRKIFLLVAKEVVGARSENWARWKEMTYVQGFK
jgi:hypothetical protein